MYSISSLKHGLEKPHLIARELDRLYFSRFKTRSCNPDGESIFEKDWDNLIILDACRADIFQDIVSLPGETETRTTLGTATFEFVPANFKNKVLHDTVYITANSWYTSLKDELDSEVHALIDVEQKNLPANARDPFFETVKPNVVTQHAIRASKEYPHKRLIIHHNQPHYPYIGETGRTLLTTASSSLRKAIDAHEGPLSQADLIKAYAENLEIVLKEVEQLLPYLHGKTVITADHGELLGERHKFLPLRDYGHPPQVYNKELTEVPWHIITDGERKAISSESPNQEAEEVDTDVEDNLRKLGYL